MTEEYNNSGGWPVRCSRCGNPMWEGDEYLIVQKVVLRKAGSMGNLVKVIDEQVLCLTDCSLGEDSTEVLQEATK